MGVGGGVHTEIWLHRPNIVFSNCLTCSVT